MTSSVGMERMAATCSHPTKKGVMFPRNVRESALPHCPPRLVLEDHRARDLHVPSSALQEADLLWYVATSVLHLPHCCESTHEDRGSFEDLIQKVDTEFNFARPPRNLPSLFMTEKGKEKLRRSLLYYTAFFL